MSLPYFQEFGWQPTVLTVNPNFVEGVRDPLLKKSLPEGLDVVATRALPVKQTRRVGVGNLGLRALPYLQRAGDDLLRTSEIDLVYFSTTVFPVMKLGARWRQRFQVPYVLDFQDPWLSDYYDSPNAPVPPGGRLKYRMSQFIASRFEPRAMRDVRHIISVSPAYPQILQSRYDWLREDQFTVLPFGASEHDFAYANELDVRQNVFNAQDGKRHWVYVGRGGGDMAKSLRILFGAIRRERERQPERFDDIRLHFIGTDYAPPDRATKTVEPIAHEFGIADIVEERTGRVPYFEALKLLIDSDAIMLFGSDDPGYTASKLYPCILARKPILAVFHEESTVIDVLHRCNAGRAVTFNDEPRSFDDAVPVADEHLAWLLTLPRGYEPEINWREFEPYTAREMTRRQCAVFDLCDDSVAR